MPCLCYAVACRSLLQLSGAHVTIGTISGRTIGTISGTIGTISGRCRKIVMRQPALNSGGSLSTAPSAQLPLHSAECCPRTADVKARSPPRSSARRAHIGQTRTRVIMRVTALAIIAAAQARPSSSSECGHNGFPPGIHTFCVSAHDTAIRRQWDSPPASGEIPRVTATVGFGGGRELLHCPGTSTLKASPLSRV